MVNGDNGIGSGSDLFLVRIVNEAVHYAITHALVE
jgi:hypothetical protein